MHGLQRVFIGDADADALGIPDGRFKHLLRRVGPVLAVADSAQRVGGARRARARVEKYYRARDVAMARMREDYRVTHDLVDAAPGPQAAAQPSNRLAAVTSSVKQ
ncbi:hypothetical protein GA0061091_10139 [Gordonia sp. v-85]|nr:hypothetical protein GA0061091_10139 [Gordonia sp. v-85]